MVCFVLKIDTNNIMFFNGKKPDMVISPYCPDTDF